MNNNVPADAERVAFAESLAAELTSAAYPVALGRGLAGSWIELELGLWRALAETVQRWAAEFPPAEFARRPEVFLQELTEGAVAVAREHRIKGPPFAVEVGLYLAIRSVVRRVREEPRRRTRGVSCR